MKNAMSEDFSWERSAKVYLVLYEKALSMRTVVKEKTQYKSKIL